MRENRTSSSMRGAQETCDNATRLCPTLLKPWAYSCSVDINLTKEQIAGISRHVAGIPEPGMGVRGKGAALEAPCPTQYWRDPRRSRAR